MLPREGRKRVAIEHVTPELDGGEFPVKRIVGDAVEVEADVFADGTAGVAARLCYHPAGRKTWDEIPMEPVGNDRWRVTFAVTETGRFRYTVRAWADPFLTWRDSALKRLETGTIDRANVEEAIGLLKTLKRRLRGADYHELAERLRTVEPLLESSPPEAARTLVDSTLATLVQAHPLRSHVVTYRKELEILVDPPHARHSAWYEVFPRSTSPKIGLAGTLRDLTARLRYIAKLGFDVVYLPPIHPIGRTGRRGANNTPAAGPDDPGSPWAIGNAEGGHTEIDRELGTIEDFQRVFFEARRVGLEVALDLAFQCSPDHPWVREHPAWFRHRADGSIQTAENPPKKYEDIYPLDFQTPDWRHLWQALLGVVQYWVDQGIRTFRVDNPHTKPFEFWEWLIRAVRDRHPEVLFLAEAFTRPKVMYRLAKIGFTHSYTYFTWRTSKTEMVAYFRELTEPPVGEFFRPHLWTNTPDILPVHLQTGGRPAFASWFILAATLSANYGIYGPPFELLENQPLVPGHEEYLNSEKYQIRHWDLELPQSLGNLIGQVNRIRKENPALQEIRGLVFHEVDNPQIVAYSRATRDHSNVLLVVVNLDPRNTQSGWTDLRLGDLGLVKDEEFQVHDLLSERKYMWRGSRNYVELRPLEMPAHIFRIHPTALRTVGTGVIG